MLGCEATNDRSESALGGTTHQLQKYGHIGLTNAAAVSDAKTNGYFSQFSSNINRTKTKGMFHQLEPKICECLLMVAIEDAPQTVSITETRWTTREKQRGKSKKRLRRRIKKKHKRV